MLGIAYHVQRRLEVGASVVSLPGRGGPGWPGGKSRRTEPLAVSFTDRSTDRGYLHSKADLTEGVILNRADRVFCDPEVAILEKDIMETSANTFFAADGFLSNFSDQILTFVSPAM